jgi:hypothetical protein
MTGTFPLADFGPSLNYNFNVATCFNKPERGDFNDH